MSIKINTGRRAVPVRAVIYGPEGVGKSTLAAALPSPLFLDVEDGTAQLDVASVATPTWDLLQFAIRDLAKDPQGYKTVIVDSADWAEKALMEHVLKSSKKDSIEDFGFGKGYTIIAEHWMRFLAECDRLTAAGLNVVFTAHSMVKRMSPPDQTDGYDRYELKLSKQVAPLLKEWSDLLLYSTYKTQVVEGTDGRIKATGGKERVMHATHSAAWDAKNRYGLPDCMPMAFSSISRIFAGSVAPIALTLTAPGPSIVDGATGDQIASLVAYSKTEIGAPVIERALEKANAMEVAELTREQAEKTIAFLAGKFAETAAKTPAPAAVAATVPPAMPSDLSAWFAKHEGAVNTYLSKIKWIDAGQTFRDLPVDKVAKIDDRRSQFARNAGIEKEAA